MKLAPFATAATRSTPMAIYLGGYLLHSNFQYLPNKKHNDITITVPSMFYKINAISLEGASIGP